MGAQRSRAITVAVVAIFLVMALGGQAVADRVVDVSGADTTAAVGRAASSYLTGIRTYAAAALWNRIDPIMHHYYEDVSFKDLRYTLTTIAVVQWLDPHAADSYYTGSWLLIENDRIDDGIAMAERGVERNPNAGLLAMNLAQIRMLQQNDLEGAVEVGKTALEPGTVWADALEAHNALLILVSVFRAAGRDDLVAAAQEQIARVIAEEPEAFEHMDHDHDGDGVPDH